MKSQESGPVTAAAAIIPVEKHNDRLTPLFAQHYRRVLMSAYRIAGNMADAEDVAQGVFLRLGSGEAAAAGRPRFCGDDSRDVLRAPYWPGSTANCR